VSFGLIIRFMAANFFVFFIFVYQDDKRSTKQKYHFKVSRVEIMVLAVSTD